MLRFHTLIVVFFLSVFSLGLLAQAPPKEEAKKDSTAKEAPQKEEKSKKKKKKGKSFEEVVEGLEVIEGLFTFYRDPEEEKVYLEIKPEQFDKLYLCNITRVSGGGSSYDGGAMLENFPFFFKRVGKKVQFIEKNLKFRADKDAAISRALERDINHSLRGSAKLASRPHEERGSVLINAADLFLVDIGRVGSSGGDKKLHASYSLDKGNSYFSKLKSFPQNSEIEITLYFKSGRHQPSFYLADSRSMIHRYHYSLTTVPENSYRPRIADDRVGHFVTLYQDYTSVLNKDPYQRYIERWHLEKAEPRFRHSKPKKPITYWLENTIPVEYREAVKEGVLLWNTAFERIGFENAIEVKQMPDDADWDPADVRYNTIRWIVQPDRRYAVGPSHADPRDGQIYAADIRISADIVRFFYRKFDEVVGPTAFTQNTIEKYFREYGVLDEQPRERELFLCRYGSGLTHQLTLGWNLLQARGIANNPAELEKFLHDALVNLVAHEVGHTLGLRHNFKASSIWPESKIGDAQYTTQNGLTGSVMDYAPVNIAPKGKKQGQYFQTSLGPYDYWAIEYAYTPFDPNSKESEKEMLAKIAGRVGKPELRYGTDEDAFGLSPRSIDPTCNLWDLGNDPLHYYQDRIALTHELWDQLIDYMEKNEQLYTRVREAFNQGLVEYLQAGLTASKYVGGIYHYRDHIGDSGERLPFQLVPAAKQREALQFLNRTFFAPNSFHFSPELLNRLAPDRQWDFESTPFRISRLDYPIHGIVQLLQAMTLFRLYHPLALARIQDNEIRFPKGQQPFTMAEMFQSLREAIWQEVAEGQSINSFRRELQRIHLKVLTQIVVQAAGVYPHDAITLARYDLSQLQEALQSRLQQGHLDTYTLAHLQESAAKIKAALEARAEQKF